MSVVSRFLEPALVERLNHLQLSARSVVEGSTIGSHKSPVKGASIEFRQHRPYVHGDEPRRLDWRVLGRTDRPYIKEYDEETNLRCVLMLDCSGSMAYGQESKWGSKFDYAARLAVSLAYLMLGQTESVGLCAFGQKITNWLAPHPGTAQLSRVVEAIEKVSPKGESLVAGAMHGTAERLERRALVVVISDFMVPAAQFKEGLAHLRHDRHEVIALRVLDRDEIEFPFRRWTRFRGLEGERASLCEPSLVRKGYVANQRRHARELDEACRALRAECRTFVTDKSLADSLAAFLHHRLAR
ncbi:MAG TPA: DUF58 domain-containing protein [Tepidisphaeraceae bacterium]|jgi:uncharacterized protein (DUF58 family)